MKIFVTILFAACLLPSAQAAETQPTRLIGYYSNVQVEGTDDPHFISGYNIALYQREAETLAHVTVAIGGIEPAHATISELTYDPKKKLLTFSANYSAGNTTNPVKGAPRREALEVLTFSGVVRPQSILGKMGVKDFYCGKCAPVFTRVKLKRIKEMGRTGDLRDFPE
jgi:hypothetical protein